MSQRWRKLRRRCSVQDPSGAKEILVEQNSSARGMIYTVRSTPVSREASPVPKSVQSEDTSKKFQQSKSLRLSGNLKKFCSKNLSIRRREKISWV